MNGERRTCACVLSRLKSRASFAFRENSRQPSAVSRQPSAVSKTLAILTSVATEAELNGAVGRMEDYKWGIASRDGQNEGGRGRPPHIHNSVTFWSLCLPSQLSNLYHPAKARISWCRTSAKGLSWCSGLSWSYHPSVRCWSRSRCHHQPCQSSLQLLRRC